MNIYGYEVAFEHVSENNWSAYCPVLSGVGAGGSTREEVEQKMRELIPLHLEGMKEDALPVHAPPTGK